MLHVHVCASCNATILQRILCKGTRERSRCCLVLDLQEVVREPTFRSGGRYPAIRPPIRILVDDFDAVPLLEGKLVLLRGLEGVRHLRVQPNLEMENGKAAALMNNDISLLSSNCEHERSP